MSGEKQLGTPDGFRRIKRQRYRESAFVGQYDNRYRSGLNAVSTLVETGWAARLAEGLVLDCGAGTGRISLPMKERKLAVIALDSSTGMLGELREKAPLPCLAGDIFNLPVRPGGIDTLVCFHLLFHLPDWREALAEFSRALRPGGRLIFEMRSGEHVALARRAMRLFRRSHTAEPGDPAGATFHATCGEVSSALKACGLSLEARRNYDLGHSYYLSPFNTAMDRAFSKHPALCRLQAAFELFAGKILPPSLTYRTLYSAVKR